MEQDLKWVWTPPPAATPPTTATPTKPYPPRPHIYPQDRPHPLSHTHLVIQMYVLDDGRHLHNSLTTLRELSRHSETATDVCAHLHSHVVWFRGGRQDTHTASKATLQGLGGRGGGGGGGGDGLIEGKGERREKRM